MLFRHVYADFRCFCQRRLLAIEGDKDFKLIQDGGKLLVELRCSTCKKSYRVEAMPVPAGITKDI